MPNRSKKQNVLKIEYLPNPLAVHNLSTGSISWKTHPARLIRKMKIQRLEQSKSDFEKEIYCSEEQMEESMKTLS